MGWPSYLEDINEANLEAHESKAAQSNLQAGFRESKQELRARNIAVVTENLALRENEAKLMAVLHELKAKILQLNLLNTQRQETVNQLRDELEIERQLRREAEREIRRRDRELMQESDDFGKMIEAYLTKEQIDKNKPGERSK